MNQVDARGLSCPEPVLMVKKALQKGCPLKVLVDNRTAVQNITRLVQNQRLTVQCAQSGPDFELLIQ